MKKFEVITDVAAATGKSKALVREILDAAAGVVRDAIQRHDPVFIFGVGKLSVTRRKTRPGRNPRTGETVTVPERNVVRFRPSESMVAAANVKAD